MTPEERELRRALEGRSGDPSPQFRARLTAAFDEGKPASGLMQAVAMVAVVAITLGTVGALVMSRNARNVAHQGVVSPSRLSPPMASGSPLASPTASPDSARQDPFQFPYQLPSGTLISAPSSDVVWAVVGGSVLYRSTDRGNTWEKRPALPTKPVVELLFIDAQQGWYLTQGPPDNWCNARQIWHTADGGATWLKVSVEAWMPPYARGEYPDYLCREGLSFIDAQHGFVSAWEVNRRPTIYRTADGGKTWSGFTLPDPPDFQTTDGTPGHYLRIRLVKRFGNTLYVMAWGTQPGPQFRQYMFRSTDGGVTWSWLMKIPSVYVVMVTESRWLLLLAPGQSMESTNWGQQWHPYASDFITDAPPGGPHLVFADSQVGYAEGNGALQRTVDGGLHWTRIAAPGAPAPQAGLLPITDPGFTCRLAVISGYSPYPSVGGFVAVPRGTFEQDPVASMVAVKDQGWSVETSTQPVLKGSRGFSFDAPHSRWVPASPELLSSDGSQYTWIEGSALIPNRLHVTRVSDGSDMSFDVAPPKDPDLRGPLYPHPLAITKDSVLLTYGWEGDYGVFRLDLASGLLTKLSGQAHPVAYGAGAVWLEPLRGTATGPGIGDTLARLDLTSGAVIDWFHRDHALVRYLGTDKSGNPWVSASSQQEVEIWKVRGPGQADRVLTGQGLSWLFTDTHGTWFANSTGVYLYAGDRMQRVSSARVGAVVGPCI